MSDNEEIDYDILKLNAKYFALESLCLAIVKSLPNASEVKAKFQENANELNVNLLYDGELTDEVFHEFELAHKKIAELLHLLNKPS